MGATEKRYSCDSNDLPYTLNGMKEERVRSKLDEIAHVCTRFDLSVHT